MTENEWLTTDRFRDMASRLTPTTAHPPRGWRGLLRQTVGRWFGGQPAAMLPPLVTATPRRSLLLTAACWKFVWHELGAPPHPALTTVDMWVELLERHANKTPQPSDEAILHYFRHPDFAAPATDAQSWAFTCLQGEDPVNFWTVVGAVTFIPVLAWFFPEESQVGCDLIRDIYGNPFREAEFRPEWRTSTAKGLAEAVYEEKAFDRMPILADALEDAGCDDAAVLAHCREALVHVRGCWVVDRVLEKT